MRKKSIMKQNAELFERLQEATGEIASLKRELDEKNLEIKRLSDELKTSESEDIKNTPIQKLEEKVISYVGITPDVEYGADAIGRIVVKAADYSNRLTVGGQTEHKDLVNLILGKTEVAKSEILSAVSSDGENNSKIESINTIEQKTYEYFDNVMAQLL